MQTIEKIPINITHTIAGIEIKEVKWNVAINKFLGFVKCPIWSKPEFNGGFVTCSWRKNGTCINGNRPDLNINVKEFKF